MRHLPQCSYGHASMPGYSSYNDEVGIKYQSINHTNGLLFCCSVKFLSFPESIKTNVDFPVVSFISVQIIIKEKTEIIFCQSYYYISRNRPTRNKNCLWWPHLLTDQDEMSNLNRGLSTDASFPVSIWPSSFREDF